MNYYPSISEDLLKKALRFARQFTVITDKEIGLIMHCRKSVLIGKDGSHWIKKANGNFDVAMGSYDSAEVCDLVGLFLLWRIGRLIPELLVGLYRDDGLSAMKGNVQEIERVCKKIAKLFKEEGLSITCEGNVKVVDFLDVVLDLETGSFKPFTKVNANTKYVSPQSSHPPSIISNIPDGINRRLCSISSSEEMFQKEVDHYQKALDDAGYNVKLEYQEEDNSRKQNKKNRSRNVIWFNPPYSSNVKTNIGSRFLSLLRKHFPPNSELYKLFNVKKVKFSYSCCPSMMKIISDHNKKVLGKRQTRAGSGCNCEDGVESCPFEGDCLSKNQIYKATVSSIQGRKEYIGQTANSFKERYGNHKNSFVKAYKRKSTALSTYIWSLKRKGIDYDIKWSSLCEALPYQGGGGLCNLCITEKTFIARSDPNKTLNKRSEVMAKCRHKLPFYLNNFHGMKIPETVEEEEGSEEEEEEETDEEQLDGSYPEEGMITRTKAKNLSNLEFFEL